MVTNPTLGLTNADVVRLRAARDIVAGIAPVWAADSRYSGQLPTLEMLRDGLDRLATDVEGYIAVQGT